MAPTEAKITLCVSMPSRAPCSSAGRCRLSRRRGSESPACLSTSRTVSTQGRACRPGRCQLCALKKSRIFVLPSEPLHGNMDNTRKSPVDRLQLRHCRRPPAMKAFGPGLKPRLSPAGPIRLCSPHPLALLLTEGEDGTACRGRSSGLSATSWESRLPDS